MAENNSVNDSYNPPPIATEFEETLFEDVETDDLIWLSNESLDGIENPVHRKLSDMSVQNLQTGQIFNLQLRQKVYQKT